MVTTQNITTNAIQTMCYNALTTLNITPSQKVPQAESKPKDLMYEALEERIQYANDLIKNSSESENPYTEIIKAVIKEYYSTLSKFKTPTDDSR